MRRLLFWTHVAAALTAGAVVLIMAGTGVLLTYERQITRWADTRGLDTAPPRTGDERVAPGSLIAHAQAATTARPTALRIERDPSAPVTVELGRDSLLLLNPWTGAVLGSGHAPTRNFFRAVESWHRWLGMRDASVRTGRAITGAANVVFLLLILSGLVLWIPRNATRAALRNVLLPRRGLKARARDFNWHNVTGAWSALPLLIIVATGAVISYAWAGALVARLAGEPQQRVAAATVAFDTTDIGIDQRFAHAAARVADWRSITIQLIPRGAAWTFIIDRGNGGQPHRRALLSLSAAGDELHFETFGDRTRADRTRDVMRYMHTGEVLGVPGQTLAGLVSAATLLLAWTGTSLLLRRFRKWRHRPPAPPN